MAVLLTAPIVWISVLKNQNESEWVRDFGEVPTFSYAANGGSNAFLHFDTVRRVSMILLLPKKTEAAAAEQALDLFVRTKQWADSALRNPNPHDAKPQHVHFVAMSESFPLAEDADYTTVQLSPGDSILWPNDASGTSKLGDLNSPMMLLISQEGRFSAVLPALAPEAENLLRRTLARLTADTYLYHYLTLQSLMWRKASDKMRGKSL